MLLLEMSSSLPFGEKTMNSSLDTSDRTRLVSILSRARDALLARCPYHFEGENGLAPHHIDKGRDVPISCELSNEEDALLEDFITALAEMNL